MRQDSWLRFPTPVALHVSRPKADGIPVSDEEVRLQIYLQMSPPDLCRKIAESLSPKPGEFTDQNLLAINIYDLHIENTGPIQDFEPYHVPGLVGDRVFHLLSRRMAREDADRIRDELVTGEKGRQYSFTISSLLIFSAIALFLWQHEWRRCDEFGTTI